MEQDAPEATTEPQASEIAEDTLGISQGANEAEIEPQEAEPTSEEQLTEESAPQEPQDDTVNLYISMPREKPSPIPH